MLSRRTFPIYVRNVRVSAYTWKTQLSSYDTEINTLWWWQCHFDSSIRLFSSHYVGNKMFIRSGWEWNRKISRESTEKSFFSLSCVVVNFFFNLYVSGDSDTFSLFSSCCLHTSFVVSHVVNSILLNEISPFFLLAPSYKFRRSHIEQFPIKAQLLRSGEHIQFTHFIRDFSFNFTPWLMGEKALNKDYLKNADSIWKTICGWKVLCKNLMLIDQWKRDNKISINHLQIN